MEREQKDSVFEIRRAKDTEWDTVMELAFKVFLKYESVEYGEEGIRSFAEFVTDEALKKMFLIGEYLLFVALDGEKIVGLISLRSGNHISLLFVDDKYHRKGIGSALIKCLQEHLLKNTRYEKMTVFASPYGIPFYHKVGFRDTGKQTKREGIIFTPMEFYL